MTDNSKYEFHNFRFSWEKYGTKETYSRTLVERKGTHLVRDNPTGVFWTHMMDYIYPEGGDGIDLNTVEFEFLGVSNTYLPLPNENEEEVA